MTRSSSSRSARAFFFVFCTFRSRAGCSCPINTEKWPVLLLRGRRKVFSTNVHFFQICKWDVGFRENLDFYRLSNIPPPIVLWSGLLGQVIRITDSCEAKQFMDSLLHELYSNQCVPELVVRTAIYESGLCPVVSPSFLTQPLLTTQCSVLEIMGCRL